MLFFFFKLSELYLFFLFRQGGSISYGAVILRGPVGYSCMDNMKSIIFCVYFLRLNVALCCEKLCLNVPSVSPI